MKKAELNARLISAAGFVRQGAHFADVGTDHAYLPIFLLKEGKICSAVCSDINEGPLENAKRNARENGVFEKMKFLLCDGVSEILSYGVTDVAVCGMGGELIADIISRAPDLKNEKIRLILQPMSRQAVLRKQLYTLGFSIIEEAYSYDAGKYYVVMAVEYMGRVEMISDFEAEFGNLPPRASLSKEALGYLEVKLRALERAVLGKTQGGETCFPEKTLYFELCEYLGINSDVLDGGKE